MYRVRAGMLSILGCAVIISDDLIIAHTYEGYPPSNYYGNTCAGHTMRLGNFLQTATCLFLASLTRNITPTSTHRSPKSTRFFLSLNPFCSHDHCLVSILAHLILIYITQQTRDILPPSTRQKSCPHSTASSPSEAPQCHLLCPAPQPCVQSCPLVARSPASCTGRL